MGARSRPDDESGTDRRSTTGERSGETATPPSNDSTDDPDRFAWYRWRCPVCQKTNTAFELGGPRFRALTGLKLHIRMTDGNGHGAWSAYPDDVDEEYLVEYVTPVAE